MAYAMEESNDGSLAGHRTGEPQHQPPVQLTDIKIVVRSFVCRFVVRKLRKSLPMDTTVRYVECIDMRKHDARAVTMIR